MQILRENREMRSERWNANHIATQPVYHSVFGGNQQWLSSISAGGFVGKSTSMVHRPIEYSKKNSSKQGKRRA
jgi:hypothetical protein